MDGTALPISAAKQRLVELLKRAQEHREVITITRKGVPAGVLMGVDDYESLWETLEILADHEVVRSLGRSRRQAAKGKFHSDDEVWS